MNLSRHSTRASLAVLFTLAGAPLLCAQSNQAIDNLYVDLAAPDLPALSALGLNPSKVSRPGTMKEFSAAVFPLAGDEGTIGPGVAIAWAPVYTFANSIDDYRKPVLRRIAFSLVTAKEGTSNAMNAGFGMRVILFDHSDPVISSAYEGQIFAVLSSGDDLTRRSRDFEQSAEPIMKRVAEAMTPDTRLRLKIESDLVTWWDLRAAAVSPFTASAKLAAFKQKVANEAKANELPPPNLQPVQSDLEHLAGSFVDQVFLAAPPVKAQLDNIAEQFAEAHWNAASAAIDFGIVGQSATGAWGDLKDRKYGGLFNLAVPVGADSQIVVQLQGRKGTGNLPQERSFTGVGARWLVGSATTRFSAEAYRSTADSTKAEDNGTSRRFTIGTEFRFAEGFWLELAFGDQRKPQDDKWHLLSLANFKYEFKAAPRFAQIPGSS